jgi:hypothetical protein
MNFGIDSETKVYLFEKKNQSVYYTSRTLHETELEKTVSTSGPKSVGMSLKEKTCI